MGRKHGIWGKYPRLTVLTGCAALAGGLLATAAGPASASAGQRAPVHRVHRTVLATAGCSLGHGVKHVVQLTFDNVHFFRDNPNVPSDLEMMPNLLHFFEHNGTMLSNNHTPLIAHTANDILTTQTGLYADRHGMWGGSNNYRTFNPDGSTDPASAFAYWTDPVFDTASTPTAGHDTNPSMVYSPVPPATAHPAPKPDTITPAPWVSYTRTGCDAGYVGTANVELENTAVDIPKVFGPNSPEAQQLAQDPDSFKDAETADYVGVAVHCAQGSAFCANAQGVSSARPLPAPPPRPTCCPMSQAATPGSRACSGTGTSLPSSGPAPRT